jgi:hypothetical protein
MTVISSKEFAANQQKYFNLALKEEDVCIKRGQNRFHLTYQNENETVYYEPDEDFYRSITMDELLEKVLEDIHQFYVNKSN